MKRDDIVWDENSRIMRLIGDRLVEKGWATRVVTNDTGIMVDFTDIGRVKFSALRALLTELEYFTFTLDHHVALLSLLRLVE